MTQGPYDDDAGRRTPSWYSNGGGAQQPQHSAERPADPTYRQPPSAAEPGGYGVPHPGYPPYRHPQSAYANHPGHRGYAPPQRGYPPPGHAPSPGYSPTPGSDELAHMHGMQAAQAQSAATTALVLAIIGFFTLPFVLGPLAIWQASKAHRLGHEATPGRILGWVCTLWGIGIFVGPFLIMMLAITATGL